MGTFNDLTGQKFNRLTALCRIENRGTITMWQAQCDCGNLLPVRAQHLRNGNTKSCGCWNIDSLVTRSTKHGLTGTRVYRAWKSMIQRCSNPQTNSWHLYGMRGIKVCKRWAKFENFFADMGHPPPGTSIDRINTNGGYRKSNCRWATTKEQANNTRVNRWITWHRQRLTLSQWAEKFQLNPSTLHAYMKKHGDKEALEYYLRKSTLRIEV